MNDILNELYYNKGFSALGLNAFIKAVQKTNKEIKKK